MALKTQVKTDWVKALRSGEYKQARQVLCNSKGDMCCLGVLFDACIDANWLEVEPGMGGDAAWGIRDMDFDWWSRKNYVTVNDSTLTSPLLKRTGLEDEDMDQLIEMNDRQQASFDQIADFIEANL